MWLCEKRTITITLAHVSAEDDPFPSRLLPGCPNRQNSNSTRRCPFSIIGPCPLRQSQILSASMFPPPLTLPLTLLTLISSVLARGFPEDYAPNVNQSCPDITTAPLVRVFTPQNQSLHPGEESFVSERLASVIPQAWSDWLGDGSGIGYNLSAFGNESAKIGISISGGGYRAAQYGAGVLSALDARNQSAKHAGTGGFLQVTSYLSGLSGQCYNYVYGVTRC